MTKREAAARALGITTGLSATVTLVILLIKALVNYARTYLTGEQVFFGSGGLVIFVMVTIGIYQDIKRQHGL